MTRLLLIILTLILYSYPSFAQRGWAFLKGEPSWDYLVAGTKGVPHHNNTPGLRHAASTWEHNGKLYLYGGEHSDLNDMWVFDTLTRSWTWLNGKQIYTVANRQPVYGTKGVAADSVSPGARSYTMTWVLNNKLYLYGGDWYDDLWSYDLATGYWTWLSGNTGNLNPVFGTKGVPSPANKPSRLQGALSWVHNGKLYLYGGNGTDGLNHGLLNDIWEYNTTTNQWTWIKGSKTAYGATSWGVKNVPANSNIPGYTVSAEAGWFLNGKLYTYSLDGDCIWEYDHTTNYWTWRKGSSGLVQRAYGKKGVADSLNTPGSGRSEPLTWSNNGRMYLYGGRTHPNVSGDLWELNPGTFNWKWIGGDSSVNTRANYGIFNHADTDIWPGARDHSQVWVSGSNIYIMGSQTHAFASDAIFQLNINTGLWKWIKGMHNPYSKDYYLQKYITDELNEPYVGHSSNSWQISDTIYSMGTYPHPSKKYQPENILWRYSIDKNIWTPTEVFSSYYPRFGVPGVADYRNHPGFRSGSVCWQYNNKLYLYSGGLHAGPKLFDDMWEYDIQSGNWRWLKGDTVLSQAHPYKAPIYGTKGISASSNTPGCRMDALSWVANGKLYLFGGMTYDSTKMYWTSDIWEYNISTNNWTWIKGSKTGDLGTYGTKGIAAANNNPGFRHGMSGCYINSKFYMFGGDAYLPNAGMNRANDLWEYDPATNLWRWLEGSNAPAAQTIFGTKNIPDSVNTPGRRTGSSMWGLNGKIYLLGGLSEHGPPLTVFAYGITDDLWEYNLNTGNWTWIDGSQGYKRNGFFDKKSVIDSLHTPGAGQYGITSTHDKRLYLIGGSRTATNTMPVLSDVEHNNTVWFYQVCDSPHLCYPNPPVINLNRVEILCNNRTLTLNAGNIGCRYLWSTNDTTQSIPVTSPGNYWVRVTNPANLSATDTVTVISAIAPFISLGADTMICSPDSIVLNANYPGSISYWSTDDTGTNITVKNEGVYSVLIIDTNGCYVADNIVIDTNTTPSKPKFVNNGPVCAGDSIHIFDNSLVQRHAKIFGPQGYLDTGVQYWINKSKVSDTGYYYIIDSLDGCSSSDTTYVKVDSVFTPTVQLNVTPGNVVWPFVQVTFTAQVNYDSIHTTYKWYKNGNIITGHTSNEYKAIAQTELLESDIICVQINNNNKCATIDTASACTQPVHINLSIDDNRMDARVVIHPNPVKESLNIDGVQKGSILRIYDMYSRLVFETMTNVEQTSIDTRQLLPANYIIQIIEPTNKSLVYKIVKE